jgi:DNA-binding MarR family transcriptional regulator
MDGRTKIKVAIAKKGGIDFSQLLKETGLSGPVLSKYIREFEEEKIIKHKISSKDRRKKIYVLTKKGSRDRDNKDFYVALRFAEKTLNVALKHFKETGNPEASMTELYSAMAHILIFFRLLGVEENDSEHYRNIEEYYLWWFSYEMRIGAYGNRKASLF